MPILKAIEEVKRPPQNSGNYRRFLLETCLQCGNVFTSRRHNQAPVCETHTHEYHHLCKLVSTAKARRKKVGEFPTLKPTDLFPYPEKCPVLGITLKWPWERDGTTQAQDDSYSIDRLNPNETYTAENCHLISFRANHLKSNATSEELRKIVDWMEKHQ